MQDAENSESVARPSRLRYTSWLGAAFVVALGAVLYLRSFTDTPIYIGGDEAHFAIHGHAIATTGRDLQGNFMPLFFNLEGNVGPTSSSVLWYQPILFYLIALTLKVLPLSEWSIRVPNLVMGLLDLVLIYGVARRLWPRSIYPTIAALLLLLAPAHLIFSRQATDTLCPVTFILAWLWCLTISLQTGRLAAAFFSGLLLGIAMFSYIAAWMLMPLLLLLGWIAQLRSPRRMLPALASTAGFAMPALALASWLALNPDMVSVTFGRYRPTGAGTRTLIQQATDYLSYTSIEAHVATYWDYFNPSPLFLTGGNRITTATRRAGIFPWTMIVFLVAGMVELVRRARGEPVAILLLGGFLLAPVPAAMVEERGALQRALGFLPFGVLIATYGVALLWRQRLRVKLVTLALLLAIPLQYALFYRDYFGDYRARSAYWYDPQDFRGIAAYLLSDQVLATTPFIYFSENLDDVAARWRFYLAKSGREDLMERTRFSNPASFDEAAIPPGSLLVAYPSDSRVPALLSLPHWTPAHTVMDEATGSKAAVLLRKTGGG